MKNKERFFFFHYRWYAGKDSGHANCSLRSAGFPSKKDLEKEFRSIVIKTHGYSEDQDVNIVITGWQEMTEEDYKKYSYA